MTGSKEKKTPLCCPYCDKEIMLANLPYCQECGLTVLYCPACKKPVPRETRVCIHCGAEIKV